MYRMASNAEKYQTLHQMGNGKIATIPYVGIILIVMSALFVYVLTSTKFDKKIYAVGSNQKGVLTTRINVSLMKVTVFVIAGIMTGIGAFLWIAMNASSDPATTGNSYEMYAIAAVVLGGISMSGGKGIVWGFCLEQCLIQSLIKLLWH